MNALRQLLAIVAKDLLIEWRTRDLVSTMGALGFTVIVLFSFAVDFSQVSFQALGPPVVWMAFVFTANAGLARSFGLERENRCLEGLLLSPIDRSLLYLGKLAVNFLVLLAQVLFLLALALLLLNRGPGAVVLSGSRLAAVLGTAALNALGFAAIGTLFALMAQRTKRGDLLLPLLQSVLSLPLLIAAVVATRRLLDPGLPLATAGGALQLSGVFVVVFVALAVLLFEFVVEE